MKKLFVCGTALALLAGCSDKPKVEEVKVLDATCEKVVAFAEGDMIVKCPIVESLVALQTQTPNAKFVQGGEFNFADAAADAEHIYINVIPVNAYEWATKPEYRVLIKEPNFEGDSMWAVRVITD